MNIIVKCSCEALFNENEAVYKNVNEVKLYERIMKIIKDVGGAKFVRARSNYFKKA